MPVLDDTNELAAARVAYAKLVWKYFASAKTRDEYRSFLATEAALWYATVSQVEGRKAVVKRFKIEAGETK